MVDSKGIYGYDYTQLRGFKYIATLKLEEIERIAYSYPNPKKLAVMLQTLIREVELLNNTRHIHEEE